MMYIHNTIKKLKLSLAELLDLKAARRSFTPLDDDICIVSFPKSGNTWTRFLIASYIKGTENVDFKSIEKLMPDIYQNSDAALLRSPKPRILKSHEVFDPMYKKVIYIYRDPRDVLVSSYFFAKKMKSIGDNHSISNFTEKFIFTGLNDHGNWFENVNSWWSAKHSNIIFVCYEELLNRPSVELKKIINFIGLDYSKNIGEKAILHCSFNNMQSLEDKQGDKWKPIKSSREDIRFIRSGKSGQWMSELPKNIHDKFPPNWVSLMKELEYI